MKTLIHLNKDLLFEYNAWENANKLNWNIASYLNQFYDVNTALAFSKLYFPDFIEKDGCILLGFRYDEKIYKQWKEEFIDDISSIEKYCNLYEVADYFHLNLAQYKSDEDYNRTINELAKVLKISWEVNCKLLFPERDIYVDVSQENEITRITLYTKSILK